MSAVQNPCGQSQESVEPMFRLKLRYDPAQDKMHNVDTEMERRFWQQEQD